MKLKEASEYEYGVWNLGDFRSIKMRVVTIVRCFVVCFPHFD